jgi:hypothetical protein
VEVYRYESFDLKFKVSLWRAYRVVHSDEVVEYWKVFHGKSCHIVPPPVIASISRLLSQLSLYHHYLQTFQECIM